MSREGNYPAPPFWPERLTGAGHIGGPHPLSVLWESAVVQHDFIADGYPGPCAISFRDGQFYNWMPGCTLGRAEEYARRA